jgi:LPXTG-motif cell wall-anchored protein
MDKTDDSIWGGLINNSGNILGGIANIIAATKGQPQQTYGAAQQQPTNTGNNTILYVLLGLGLVVVLFFALKR